MIDLKKVTDQQYDRNHDLLAHTRYLSDRVASKVVPFRLQVGEGTSLNQDENRVLTALQIEAARTAISSLASLAEIGELDHLGGGLDLIPPLLMTLSMVDFEQMEYTIEHAHTSVGYYAALSAMGFVEAQDVVDHFRRGIDLPGHVSWLPGGTQLNGGRLGVMVPAAVGQSLGKRAVYGEGSWVIAHCGDAGWISGQALNGFNAADVHGAPITFVMHRNGIQLSGSTRSILDKDPRGIVNAMGIEVLEIPTLHDNVALYDAYCEGFALASNGRPSMIFPTGYRSNGDTRVDLNTFGEQHSVLAAVEAFVGENDVPMDQEIWIPGSLMSYRDIGPMLECLFLVNELPGGAGHHDGSMLGRDAEEVLSNPMLEAQSETVNALKSQTPREVVTVARPAPGSLNLILPPEAVEQVELPDDKASPRDGTQAGYALVAETFPDQVFVVSCDLDASTKLAKARGFLDENHQFELSIEEQAAALVANGLATSTRLAQLNVVSTFAAFFEGIAREGMDMWQYQRNLGGANEGLNVTYHLSHVGSCTGRDHFSGWGLDWINVGMTYLPYLHRFYAPADARSAFLAIKDLAAHYGGHIIGVPRDSGLPILQKQDGSGPLWSPSDEWEFVTSLRSYPGADRAIVAFGAPAFLGVEAAEELEKRGTPTDVWVVNGLPASEESLEKIIAPYSGVVSIEDGKIGTPDTGLRGFASLIANAASEKELSHAHIGITNPTVAPSAGFTETWEHFGITSDALVDAAVQL